MEKMKPRLILILLILALTACAQPTAIPTATIAPPTTTHTSIPSTATLTPVPPTATPSPVPTLTPTPSATPPPVRLVQWAEWELDKIYSAFWLPDSQSIVFSGRDTPELGNESLYRYTIDPPQLSWQILGAGSDFAASPDGRVIAGDTGQALTLWDAQNGQTVRGPYYGEYFGAGGYFPVFLPDGSGLLVGHTEYYDVGWSETRIDLWNYEQGDYDPVSESPTIESDGFMADLAISPNGNLLAVVLGNLLDADGFKYNQVVVWELATGSQRCAFLGELTVAFDPTGEIVAVIYNRREGSLGNERNIGELILYDVHTCQPLRTVYRSSYIATFAYSPDGKTLALAIPSGSESQSILIVDAATGDLLYEQTGPWSHIRQLEFSSDGKYLMSLDYSGAAFDVRVWQVILAPEP